MPFPLRTLVAMAIVIVLHALIGWAAVLLWQSRTAMARAVLICSVVVLIAIALWIIFVLPAYWD